MRTVDSVRGVTADIIYVVRHRCCVDAQGECSGIRSDLRGEYVSYARG
ncbi:MAG: hypothetical protein GY772_28850 [bacterium]|nr:hypothetical protein [bacterium]